MKISTRRASRRTLGAALSAAALTAGLALAGAIPAQASDWVEESSRSYCYTVSGWQDCYTDTTYRRTDAVCDQPAGSFTGGLAAWYSYCYKTVTVRH